MTSDQAPSSENSSGSSVVLDIVNAVGVNLIALVVGYPIAIIGPTFLIMVLPFGVFWGYLLLVGLYAYAQLRKGRKRRAIMAGAVAAIVLMVLAMSIRIA